ncbi:transposase [Mesorhizobium sp. M0323]|uniref:transposase n=1 Tax=Mesorhizobium sp. M0323 TaxID=2956938 RepID=UPI00333BD46B
MSHVTLLTGPERRRRWREEDQCRILAAAFAPGATVAAVARQYDVATSLIYRSNSASKNIIASPHRKLDPSTAVLRCFGRSTSVVGFSQKLAGAGKKPSQ